VKRGRLYEAVDKYAALRALAAIDRSAVAVLVLDANEGLIEQDKHVVGYAMDAKKAIVIVVNKWDLAAKGPEAQKEFDGEAARQRQNFSIMPASSTLPL
jgi:Predicted GTPases